jgi:hypothetical protein
VLKYNTNVLKYNAINKKTSIADLKTIQKCVRNLIEAIDNNEYANEHQ